MPNEPYDDGGLVTGVQMVTNNTGNPVQLYPFAHFTQKQKELLELLDAVQDYDTSDDDD